MTVPADQTVGVREEYISDLAAFRRDLTSYLQTVPFADEWRSAAFTTTEEAMNHDASLLLRLHDAGWTRYGWPVEVGGFGGGVAHRAIYFDALSAARLPVPAQNWTMEVLGPALVRFAPHLAAEFMPRYLRGQEWWGQGFSEPEAGSDLAALRTRATPDANGGFSVSGQKIWTSQGPTASRLLVLTRTGTPDSRHRGLTMVLVDADQPGVTVRPIALASGRREVAEVFFDDVRVGPERVVGEVDGGWAVVMYLMQFERGMYGYAALTKAIKELSDLRTEMIENGCSAVQRNRFAQVYLSVLAAQARSAGSVRELTLGQTLGPNSSVDKLVFARAEREVNDLLLDIRRGSLLAGSPSDAAHLDTARAEWWYSRTATLMGGTAEIQRGIIADHLLGLPKEKRA